MPFTRFIVFTYMPLPEMHFDSLLHRDSFLQRKRSFLHRVYFCGRARCAGRTRIRWAAASCGSAGRPCRSPPARHPCTTQWWAWAGPLPYSSMWWAPPWKQWHLRGAPQSVGGSLPDEDEILEHDRIKTSFDISLVIAFVWFRLTLMKWNSLFKMHLLLFYSFYSFVLNVSRKSSPFLCVMRQCNNKLMLILISYS